MSLSFDPRDQNARSVPTPHISPCSAGAMLLSTVLIRDALGTKIMGGATALCVFGVYG